MPVNSIKSTQAGALSVLAAPVNPNDVVRLQDMESSLTAYATSQQVASLQSSLGSLSPAQISAADESLNVTQPSPGDYQVSVNLVPSGSGLKVQSGPGGGLGLDFGRGPNQVPDSSDFASVLADQHPPVIPDPTAVTTTTTVTDTPTGQLLKVEVNLVPQGGLSSENGGLQVDVPTVTAEVVAAIGYAGSSNGGLMSESDYLALQALAEEQALNFGNTNTTEMVNDGNGNITTNVIPGLGITVGYVSTTGNYVSGLYDSQNIWIALTLSPSNWPAGWPNNLYWGIGVSGGIVTFSIYQDSGGSTLLASGSLSAALISAAGSPQLLTLRNPSNVVVGALLINTVSAWLVSSSQTIILTPQGVSADTTVLALKSTTDNHETRIEHLESEESSISSSVTALEAAVGTLGSNLLTASELGDTTCVALLLEKWDYAHRFIPTLRVESPTVGDITTGGASSVNVPARAINASGAANDVFTVNLQVLGVCRTKDVYLGNETGATPIKTVAGTGGRVTQNGQPYSISTSSLTSAYETQDDSLQRQIELSLPGTPDQYGTGEMISMGGGDVWALIISDDGTGKPQTYFLNTAASNAEATGAPVVLNYLLEGVNVKAGATITLQFTSAGSNAAHNLVAPGVTPYPATFPGYFIQVDAYQVIGACSIGDLEDGGTLAGIAVPGATIRKDLNLISGGSSANGYPALNASPESPGFNGPEANNPNGTELTTGNGNLSTTNQAPVALARDLTRLSLIDGGQADDIIWDILINGNDIWVAGAFSRWGCRPCPGLARLDRYGNISFDFKNFQAGFIEPIRWLSLASDGNILAASLFTGMYQGERTSPVHKIKHDGTEDTTFTCPSDLAVNDAHHQNLIIGVAGLSDGTIVVICPETLIHLDHLGNILSQLDSSGTEMFLSIAPVPETPPQLLLASHAWSAAGVAQQFNGVTNPKGLKLLSESGAGFAIDPTWALAGASPASPSPPPPGAGTGAMSTCKNILVGPNNAFIIVGNGLLQYNAVDTSWNCEILGNLLCYSELFDQDSGTIGDLGIWVVAGTLQVVSGRPVPAGVSGAVIGSLLRNTGGIGTQAYIQQSVFVAPQVNCVLAFYVKKFTSPGNMPVVQMSFTDNADGTENGSDTPITAYAWIDPYLGTYEVQDVSGALNFSIETASTDSGWWLVTMKLFNSKSINQYLTCTWFPAYSSVLGGTSTSVTGTIQVAAPSVEYDYWTQQYVPTGATNSPPAVQTSNAARFQGLYKINGPGSTTAGGSGGADPLFDCVMTFSDPGVAIPFCLDGYGNIYCGGPVSSISGNPVTPWMLYKLMPNGGFLQAFELFDDAVTVCRMHPDGYLVCGGKFTNYGSRKIGRFVIIDPVDGHVIDEVDEKSEVIASSTAPDVIQYPGAMKKIWTDLATDPPGVEVWSKSQNAWVDAASGGYPKLAPVVISDTPSIPPNLWTPSSGAGSNDGYFSDPLTISMYEATAGAAIYYTTDGTNPSIVPGTRQLYTGPFHITSPTIINAYAVLAGYANSLITNVTYGEQLYAPTITPPTQNIAFPVSVSISGPPGASILYTTDGTDPALSGTVQTYSGPFSVGTAGQVSSITVRAIAERVGYFNSEEAQTQYGDNIIPDLTITPAAGAAVPVTLALALPPSFVGGYNVVYTTSTTGIPPNPITNPAAATTAPGPLSLSLTVGTAINAYASAPGWGTDGTYLSASYGLTLAAPTLVASSGVPSLILIAGPSGSTINYTLTNTETGMTSQVYQAKSPVSVSLADMPSTTITAYASMAGWANSPSASLTAGPFLYSGLINVNFAPAGATPKVGRAAIFSDPFQDAWNQVNINLVPPNPLIENFYASDTNGNAIGSLKISLPGARTGPVGGTPLLVKSFQQIPLMGDNAYKNCLALTTTTPQTSCFDSVAYGLGIYIATTPQGSVYSSPDGINWTLIMDNLPFLTRVKFLTLPTSSPVSLTTQGFPCFIILGDSTSLLSTDGVNWTQMPNHPAGVILWDCDVGVAQYPLNNSGPGYAAIIAVGSGGTILISPPNISTTPQNLSAGWSSSLSATVGGRSAGPPFSLGGSGANLKTISASNQYSGVFWLTLGDAGGGGFAVSTNGGSVTAAAAWPFGTSNFWGYPDDVSRVCNNGSYFVAVTKMFDGTCVTLYLQTLLQDISGYAAVRKAAVPPGVTTLSDVCPFGANQFAAVGGTKIILGTISGLTLTWADITPSGSTQTFHAVAIGSGGQIIAAGTGGVVSNSNAAPNSGNWNVNTTFVPANQTNLLLGEFTGLMAGFYDLLVYGHGESSSYYSSVNAYADYQYEGGGQTTSGADFDNTNWLKSRQFIEVDGLQTVDGEIGFGIGIPPVTPLVVSYSNPSTVATTYPGGVTYLSSMSFTGIWPASWPVKVYFSVSSSGSHVIVRFFSDAAGVSQIAQLDQPDTRYGGFINILDNSAAIIGVANTAATWPVNSAISTSQYISVTESYVYGSGPLNIPLYLLKTVSWQEFDTSGSNTGSSDNSGNPNWLGMSPNSVSYSVTTVNPGVSAGQEITSMEVVGAWTSFEGQYQRTTSRTYLESIWNQQSGFCNAVQLSRVSGSGTPVGTPQIFPESLTNLAFPKTAGGTDLVAFTASAADQAAGVASGVQFRYSLTTMTYSAYLAYLAAPSGDPTPSTGTLYTGPLAVPNNASGCLVRVCATLPGRATSSVANAFFFPAYPGNAPQP